MRKSERCRLVRFDVQGGLSLGKRRALHMNRTITYQISAGDHGQKISGFLKARHYSSQNLIDLKKRNDSVLLNGQPVFQNVKIKEGDELTIHIVEEEVSMHVPPVDLPIDIVYEDEDLLVVNKPAGMPIHTSMKNYDNTLANALAYYFEKQNKPFVYRCINRLDRDTSGLTLIAKHGVSAGILGSMVAAKSGGVEDMPSLTREYLAIVRGRIGEESGMIDAPLARKGGSIIERVVDFEKGERAVTHYQVLKYENGHTLVRLRLQTGRTHQIRVHMKYIGHGLIGDYLYNPDMEYMTRQALHSHKLCFVHPMTWEPMEFVAPMPPDMQRVISYKEERMKAEEQNRKE